MFLNSIQHFALEVQQDDNARVNVISRFATIMRPRCILVILHFFKICSASGY